LKCAARGSLGMQDSKNRQNTPSGLHRTTLSDDIFATKSCIDSGKKLLNSNTSSTCPDNTVNFGQLPAEIRWRVWGTTVNFNGSRVLVALRHGTLVVGVSKLCGVEQRAPPMFGRATITLGIGPHSSCIGKGSRPLFKFSMCL